VCVLKVQFAFLCFCVSSDFFCFVLLVSLGLVSFQYRAKRLAGKNVSEMTYFVSIGRLNLAPSIREMGSKRWINAARVCDA